MPQLTFLTDNLTIEVRSGENLQEIVDRVGASLPFGCRLGSCGTCRCIIEEGIENLNPKTEAEEELFENFTSVGKNERLGCQLKILGDVKIRS